MMLKKIVITIILVICLISAFGCEYEKDNHEHTYSESFSFDEQFHWRWSTCEHKNEVIDREEHTFDGLVCSKCGYTKEEMHQHTYSTEYSTDSEYHWHSANCGHDEIEGKEKHIFENLVCSKCGYTKEELEYTLNDDNDGYIVTGIGNYKSNILYIPSVYKNLPVIGIESQAFVDCTDLLSVIIPESVMYINGPIFPLTTIVTIYCEAESKPSGWVDEWNEGMLIHYPYWGIKKTNFLEKDGFVYIVYNDEAIVTKYIGDEKEVIIPETIYLSEMSYDVTTIESFSFVDVSEFQDYLEYDYHELPVIPDSIKGITIPKTVVNIREYAFYGCISLKKIMILGNINIDELDYSCFEECIALTVYFAQEYEKIHSYAPIYFKVNETNYLEQDEFIYIIENGEAVVTRYIGKQKEIVIPDSVMLDGKKYKVTSIGERAFSYSKSIESIKMPDSIVNLSDEVFLGCTNLENIYLSNNLEYIGSSVFEHCKNLQYNEYNNIMYLGNETNQYLVAVKVNDKNLSAYALSEQTRIIFECAFEHCGSLVNISIPNSVISIGDFAFENCEFLTKITIPESVTSIGNSAFHNCISLTSITIPESVTSIESSTFYHCRSLTKITIPESVTTIGREAFDHCINLTEIIIPGSVANIGKEAFRGCINLTIYCEATEQPSEWDADWNSDNLQVYWGFKEEISQ